MNPILQALTSKNNIPMNPDALFNNMMQSNPQFKDFVEQNKNKTPEEIIRSYGANPALLNLLKR